MASQLILPLSQRFKLTRADFIVAPGNAQAVAFIDSWPSWPAPAAVLHGPPGSGKSHLGSIWRDASAATVLPAEALERLDPAAFVERGPVAIEDVDSVPAAAGRDRALFALIEGATPAAPLLLMGHEPPAVWSTVLPDLSSRFSSILAFPLWAPDDGLLAALARKLFTDRQLAVPDAVIVRMIRFLERSPSAIRDFVAKADETALAEGRPVNLSLVRELLAEMEGGAP